MQELMQAQVDYLSAVLNSDNVSLNDKANVFMDAYALAEELRKELDAIISLKTARKAQLSQEERAEAVNIYRSSSALQRRWTLAQHLAALTHLKRQDAVRETTQALLVAMREYPHPWKEDDAPDSDFEPQEPEPEVQTQEQEPSGSRRQRRRAARGEGTANGA